MREASSVSSLLLGITILLIGSGLLSSLLGIRAVLEGFPETVIGFVMSSYFLGYVVGTYTCPAVIRRIGHIRSFAVMAAIPAAATLCHVLFVDAIVWAVLRFITGFCLLGLYMVVESWLNSEVVSQQRGKIFSLYMAMTLGALGFSQLLLIGDQQDFVPFALAALMLMLGLVPVALTEMREPKPIETASLGLTHLYKVSPLGVVGSFVSGLVAGALWGMGAVFGQNIGLTTAGIAALMSVTILGGALLQWPIGHLSDRHDRRRVLATVCFCAAVVPFVAAIAPSLSSSVWLVGAFVYGGLVFSIYALCVAHVNDHLAPSDVLHATQGLLLVNGIGAVLGPVLVGWAMELFGPSSLLVFFGIVCLGLGGFSLWRMRQTPSIAIEQQGEFVVITRTSPAALEMDPRTESQQESSTS